MKTLRRFVLACTAIPLIAGAASAQYSNRIGLSSGTHVRVMASGVLPERTTGTFLSAGNDTLVMTIAGGSVSLSMPLQSIERLEVSEGRSRGRWAGIGALAGGLGGAVIGGAIGGHDDPSGWGGFAGFFGGGFLGLASGAITGALAAPERWSSYPLRFGR